MVIYHRMSLAPFSVSFKLLTLFLVLYESFDLGSGQEFCEAERDYYDVYWPTTEEGVEAEIPCPSAWDFEGYAYRYCFEGGVWDYFSYFYECQATSILGLGTFTELLFYIEDIDINGTEYIILQLVRLTQPPPDSIQEPFISADNMDILLDIVFALGDFIMNTTTFSELNPDIFVDDLYTLFSNILDARNRPSWDILVNTYDISGADVLNITERYAKFIAEGIQDQIVQFSGFNLGLTVEKRPTVEDAVFPNSAVNLANTSSVSMNSIRIPTQYLKAVAVTDLLNTNEELPVSFLIFPTVQDFLPLNTTNNDTIVGSVVLSALVGTSQMPLIPRFEEKLIELNFTLLVPKNASNISGISCVYWDFSTSSWLSDGIVTEVIDNSTVRCLSSHLTSFAVLVDVQGVYVQSTNSSDSSPGHLRALSYVSYIGTGLSVVCLIFTIIYLLTYGKELFEKVHFFLHLNLAVALLMGFIVFIGGVSHASTYIISCKIVAILLHYFFLSAFCWMLCEAILLYFLVVIVFTNITSRWYVFPVIGWLVPLIYVMIIFGAFNDSYIPDPTRICWLNYANHVIWSFTAPMCLIIMVNSVIIVITVVILYRNKRTRIRLRVGSVTNDARSMKYQENKETAIAIVKGIIFLLPLLGITWIVGLFALQENVLFFAWLFTILNSLQGVFLFVFHVVLSKKVSDTVKKLLLREGRAPSTVMGSLHGGPTTKSEEAKELEHKL